MEYCPNPQRCRRGRSRGPNPNTVNTQRGKSRGNSRGKSESRSVYHKEVTNMVVADNRSRKPKTLEQEIKAKLQDVSHLNQSVEKRDHTKPGVNAREDRL